MQPGSARRVVVSSVAAAALVVLILSPAAASGGQPATPATDLQLAGDLDPSFGSGGAVTHSLGSAEYPSVAGIAVQPDGKIVVAAGSVPGDHGLLLARYLPNGSLDPSFGDGGYVETHTGSWAFANAVALQPDGKIVVAGVSYQGGDEVLSEFTLARYNPNGSPDSSFGSGGMTNTPIPEPGVYWQAGADALALLPGGEILVAGGASWDEDTEADSVLARYTSDGSLDPGFGNGGILQPSGGEPDGIAVQPDGKIIGIRPGPGIALVRYDPTGSLDPTFGTGGEVKTGRKLHNIFGVTLQRGKVVALGDTRLSRSKYALVLTRLGATGRLDTTFGTNGSAEIRRITLDPTAVLTQSDGKLLIAATRFDYDDEGHGAVFRLLRNGRLDTSFGRGGVVSFDDQISALALQEDGSVLVGGGHGNAWTLDRLVGGNNCVVPGLSGKTVSEASVGLKHSYCSRGRISTRLSNKIERGRVISSTPRRRTRLPGGSRVDLVVSRGRPVRHP
jgi:uncharacterized delta-60 repeat protein